MNGEHFEFKGVSTWALLQGRCSPVGTDEQWLQRAFDELVQSGTKVVRAYAFQNAAGPSGYDFRVFDSAVRFARRAGIRLQWALEHEKGDCSEGPARDTAWYAGGYQSLDGAYTRSYWDYVAAVAKRYADEPTVLGYVLVQSMNVDGNIDPNALNGFVAAVAPHVHDNAKNQLVSLDLSWGKTSPADFQTIEGLSRVDLVNLDDYQRDATSMPLEPGQLTTLAKLNKPAVVGEAMFPTSGTDAASLLDRAQRATSRVQEWHDSGAVSGLLLWAYQPGWPAPNDPNKPAETFDLRNDDPLLQPDGVLDSSKW